jgi:alpha-glucosidase
LEEVSGPKGVVDLSKVPVELKNGDWIAKVVPWIGGRIISMEHLPSGNAYNPAKLFFLLLLFFLTWPR